MHDGDAHFTKKALKEAHDAAAPGSRATVVHMHPTEFLKLANHHFGSPRKVLRAAADKRAHRGYSSIPHLTVTNNGDRSATVTGHEGRHRALALRSGGLTSMPVSLRSNSSPHGAIRWSLRGTPLDPVRVHPTHLIGQDGRYTLAVPPGAYPSEKAETAAVEHKPGDEIHAEWEGKRWPATYVRGHRDGTHTVQWRDADGGGRDRVSVVHGRTAARYVPGKRLDNAREALHHVHRLGYKGALYRKAGSPAAAVWSRGVIHINASHKLWKHPEQVMAYNHIMKHVSSSHPLHVVHHEIGHHLYSAPDNFHTLEHQKIAGKVSRYAQKNPNEFVAETHAGLAAGKNYDDEVMKQFHHYARKREHSAVNKIILGRSFTGIRTALARLGSTRETAGDNHLEGFRNHPGMREVYERRARAHEHLVNNIKQFGKLNEADAKKVAGVYLKHKIASLDSVGGQSRIKHGDFYDHDVIHRALATTIEHAPGTKVMARWKTDGHHYPATYVKRHKSGRHTVKWDDGGANEHVGVADVRVRNKGE